MSPPLWILSVPIGFANVFAPFFASIFFTIKAGVDLDTANPRKQRAGEDVAKKDSGGYISRAFAAHQNGWEAMNLWVAGILLAYVMKVDEDKMNVVAAVWLAARVLYNVVYIATKDKKLAPLRSICFFTSMGCSFALMWSAAQNS